MVQHTLQVVSELIFKLRGLLSLSRFNPYRKLLRIGYLSNSFAFLLLFLVICIKSISLKAHGSSCNLQDEFEHMLGIRWVLRDRGPICIAVLIGNKASNHDGLTFTHHVGAG